jgi:peptide/nickel transport system permease protein
VTNGLISAERAAPPRPGARLSPLAKRRLRALARPLGSAAAVSLGVVLVTFTLLRTVLGDPAYVMAMKTYANQPPPEAIEDIRRRLGLDAGFFSQLGDYLWGLAHGDLGKSFQFGMPVTDVVMAGLGTTVLVALLTIVSSNVIGVALGLVTASTRWRFADFLVRLASMLALASPGALIALLLILVLAVNVGVVPAGGWGDGYPGNFRYLILPVGTLVLGSMPGVFRITYERARDILAQPHIEADRARGIPPWRINLVHVLPNCAVPLLTLVAMSFAGLLGGAVITEMIFGIPGIGHLMTNAIAAADYPVIQGLTLMTGLTVVLCNLASEVIGRVIDPRTR